MSNEFKPNRDEANELANNYWNDLSEYSNKFLKEISDTIAANAKAGKYSIVQKVLKTHADEIKKKLEDAGYTVTLEEYNEKNFFITVNFS